ncbi:MAG: PP2C family protein-serine/threonine phosphatase [Phycisphaeraceae bacterium]
MIETRLAVVTGGKALPAEAERIARAALACWPEAGRPVLTVLKGEKVQRQPRLLDQHGLVWLMLDEPDSSELYELIGPAQDRHLPVALTRSGETRVLGAIYQHGVIVCPPGSPPEGACAVLQSLWSQSPLLQELSAEVRLLRAHQGGLAGQIDRMDEELRLAAKLQREFLPSRLPRLGDVSFKSLWRPASYVSGDIFDVARLDESHLSFFVADAVGHGVPAALLTMYIKSSLRTKQIDPSAPRGYRLIEPAQALANLNKDMAAQQGGQVRFATACCGVINCETLELQIARAGHPAPFLLRSTGETEYLEPEGGLLGVFPEEEYDQHLVQLRPGDRLVLYSDGFEMAFQDDSGDDKVANTRYCREFEDLRHGPIDEALERLRDKLDGEAGSLNQRDDETVLAMVVAGEEPDEEPMMAAGAADSA